MSSASGGFASDYHRGSTLSTLNPAGGSASIRCAYRIYRATGLPVCPFYFRILATPIIQWYSDNYNYW